MAFDQLEEVIAIVRAADAVRLVGINHETELLAGLDESFDHLNAVLEMHIVIARSVSQQERASQFVSYFWQIQISCCVRCR
jgi:hypothetical protein